MAAAALLLHMVLPFFATYQVPAQVAAKNMASIFGEKLLLCTSEGFRLVKWEDIVSGKEKPKTHTQYQCPLCYVAAHGQWIASPAMPAIATALPVPLLDFFSVHDEAVFAEHDWRKLRTRSPPTSFTV